MIPSSKISQQLNHALLSNLPQLYPNPQHSKSPIHMMKGDPTEFGLQECQMNELGFQIVRDSILSPDNHSYSQSTGTMKAREAVVKHFSNGHITPDDVIITSGVNCGLYYLFLAICNEGDNILVPEIGYPFFDQIAPSYGVTVRKYHLKANENWEVDFDTLNQLLDEKTKFLFLINPSNPCGSVFSKQHVQDIVQWAELNRVLIIADEVYYGISFGQFTSFGQMANEGPMICLSGVEKLYFVPGWCTSWLIFYDKNGYASGIKEGVGNMCQLYLHSNTFLMNSLPDLFERLGVDYATKCIPQIKSNHDLLVAKLSLVPGLKPIPAQGTFYLSVLIDLTQLDFLNDVDFVKKALEEENFSAFPLSCLGSEQSYQGLRLLTCVQQEMCQDLITRLREFCGRHQR